MSKERHIFDIGNLTVGIIGAVAGISSLLLAYSVATGWTPGLFGFGSKDRFSCFVATGYTTKVKCGR